MIWEQVDIAKKQADEEEWKKADTSQRPVEEMKDAMDIDKKEPSTQPVQKKKKPMLDQNLEYCDKKTLFYQYWTSVQAKKRPLEFAGRNDMD